jgi:hypothetical protein
MRDETVWTQQYQAVRDVVCLLVDMRHVVRWVCNQMRERGRDRERKHHEALKKTQEEFVRLVPTLRSKLHYTRHLVDHPDEESANSCTICLELLDHPMLTPCAHLFCAVCIRAHLRKNGDICPNCRAPVSLSQLVDVSISRGSFLGHICGFFGGFL